MRLQRNKKVPIVISPALGYVEFTTAIPGNRKAPTLNLWNFTSPPKNVNMKQCQVSNRVCKKTIMIK